VGHYLGEIGCILSHLEAIRLYGTEDLIVFEDDVDLSTSQLWQFNLNDLIEKVRGNINMLQMVRHREYNPLYIKDHVFGNNWGTAAYFISKSICEEVVSKYYINNKWTLTSLPSKYHRKVADSVLYSLTKTYTCTLFSFADFTSSIDVGNYSRDIGPKILQEMSSQNLTLDYYTNLMSFYKS
jgi:GR25 family glycosyltransferase involved in LPS biosynthesis